MIPPTSLILYPYQEISLSLSLFVFQTQVASWSPQWASGSCSSRQAHSSLRPEHMLVHWPRLLFPQIHVDFLLLSSSSQFKYHLLGKVFFKLSYVEWTEKTMAPHSSTLAWKIPWMEEPGRLQSMGSLRVEHDWMTSLSLFTFMHWRRKWQPTPVFLPGESQGWGNLVGCRLWGHTELDTAEVT